MTLSFDNFAKHAGHPDGVQNYCRPCYNARQRQLYKEGYLRQNQLAYRKRYTERLKWKRRIRRYGVSLEVYEQLLAAQDDRCAICLGVETYEHKELCVDHDHVTGMVRGLLCSRCNKALGGFGESAALMQRAIDYLNRSLTDPVSPRP